MHVLLPGSHPGFPVAIQWFVVRKYPGIVDQDVHGTQTLDGRGERLSRFSRLANFTLHQHMILTWQVVPTCFGGQLIAHIMYRDTISARRERTTDGSSQTSRAAGDEYLASRRCVAHSLAVSSECVRRVRRSLGRSRLEDSRGLAKVEAIQFHYLVPGRHKVANEFALAVDTAINLGQGPQLRVRTKDQVDSRGGPP